MPAMCKVEGFLYMALRVLPSTSDHRRSDLLNHLIHNLHTMEAYLEDSPNPPMQSNRNGEIVYGRGSVRGSAGTTGDVQTSELVGAEKTAGGSHSKAWTDDNWGRRERDDNEDEFEDDLDADPYRQARS